MKRIILFVLVVPLLFVSCGIARSSKSIKKANALHQKAVRALVNYVGDESIVSEGRNPSVKPTAFLLVKDLDKRPVFVSYYKGKALLKESYTFASNAGYDFAVRLGNMASKEFEAVLQETAKMKKTKKSVVSTPPLKKEKKKVSPAVKTPAPVKTTPPKKAPVVATPPPVKKEEKKTAPTVATPPPTKKIAPEKAPVVATPPVKKEEKKIDSKKEKKKEPKKEEKKKEEKKKEEKGEKKKDDKVEKKKDEKKKVDYFELYQKYRKKDPEKGDSK